MSGGGDPRTVLDGIVRSADERRTLVWSDHSDEQAVLETTSIAGQLPEQSTGAPQVGVYLNDGTGSKMDYYLDYDVAVASTACHMDQSQQLRLTVTMASTAPSNAAELPISVRGPGFGAPAGSIRTNLLVYAPGGGRVTSPSIDGRPAISAPFVHEGRPVAAQTVDLKPGQSRSFTLTIRTGDDQPEQAVVQVTPGVNGSGQAEVSESACS
jgi:hypothetical protein